MALKRVGMVVVVAGLVACSSSPRPATVATSTKPDATSAATTTPTIAPTTSAPSSVAPTSAPAGIALPAGFPRAFPLPIGTVVDAVDIAPAYTVVMAVSSPDVVLLDWRAIIEKAGYSVAADPGFASTNGTEYGDLTGENATYEYHARVFSSDVDTGRGDAGQVMVEINVGPHTG